MIPISYQLYFTTVLLSGIYFSYNYVSNYSIYSYGLICMIVNAYYTLGEYIIHRYGFHLIFEKIHKKHHDDPKRYYRLFIPIPITLINECILVALSYLCCWNHVLAIASAAHFSYLLFELAHYASHYPTGTLVSFFLPRRLISFHYSHHMDDRYNFGFTTPCWDILFKTSKVPFDLYEYPLSMFPFSVVSFLTIK